MLENVRTNCADSAGGQSSCVQAAADASKLQMRTQHARSSDWANIVTGHV